MKRFIIYLFVALLVATSAPVQAGDLAAKYVAQVRGVQIDPSDDLFHVLTRDISGNTITDTYTSKDFFTLLSPALVKAYRRIKSGTYDRDVDSKIKAICNDPDVKLLMEQGYQFFLKHILLDRNKSEHIDPVNEVSCQQII
jgi:hypothetical protein